MISRVAGYLHSYFYSEKQDHLKTSNEQDRRMSYQEVKKNALQNYEGPIIVANGDYVVLYDKGQRKPVKYRPPLFHRLKEIAHLPMMLPLKKFTDPKRYEEMLHLYSSRLHMIRETIPTYGFPQEMLENQMQIVDKCITIVNELKIDSTKTINYKELTSFLNKNAEWACTCQLEALHQQMCVWKQEMSPAYWDHLSAIVIGPQTPRKQEATFEYFSLIIGSDTHHGEKGRYLIYAEHLWDEESALDLLATYLVDGEIGKAFFDSATSMYQDILSRVTVPFLEQNKDRICDAAGCA